MQLKTAGHRARIHGVCLRRIEKLKLLSKLEEAGVLSTLEKSGITLEFIEENKLLSKAESAGAISLLNDRSVLRFRAERP